MSKGDRIPNAWDDEDWEVLADRAAKEPPKPETQAPMSRDERLARHAEEQRRLWESAYVIPTWDLQDRIACLMPSCL